MKREHELYKTGDPDAPSVILDTNGEVVLGLCRHCGKGEAQLIDEPNCETEMTTNQTTILTEHIRQLSQDEVLLLEEIAALGPQLDDLCRRVRTHIIAQWEAANARTDGTSQYEVMRLAQAEPLAWLANGKMRMQEGLIGLTRAVSQPGFF